MDRQKNNLPPNINTTSPLVRRANSNSPSPSSARKKTSNKNASSTPGGGSGSGSSPLESKVARQPSPKNDYLLTSQETAVLPFPTNSEGIFDGALFSNSSLNIDNNNSNDRLESIPMTLRGDDEATPGSQRKGRSPTRGGIEAIGHKTSNDRLTLKKSRSRSLSRTRKPSHAGSYTPSSIGREHSEMVASGEIPKSLISFGKEEENTEGSEGQDPLRPKQGKIVPLKKTEVWAWYFQNATYCAYGWVSAVMMVPLLIQDVAAMNGVQTSNHSIPCDTTLADYDCVMHIFGNHYLDPGTISLYISSLSAIFSFFVSLSIAAVADHGAYRKQLLLVFAILGCLASVAFFIIQTPSLFWLTMILSPLGWACYNISSVFSNAFLPIYVRVHPKVLDAAERAALQQQLHKMDIENKLAAKEDKAESEAAATAHAVSTLPTIFEPVPQNATTSSFVPSTTTTEEKSEKGTPPPRSSHTSSPKIPSQLNLLDITPPGTQISFSTAAQRKVEEQVTNDLSAWCAGAANVGAVIVMATCIGISIGMNNSLLSLQIAIAFTGVWWLMWTIVVLPWLDARPGPPLPKGSNWIVYSWSKNYKTFKAMRRLTQVTKFIFAWFMLSDGVNTVTALLYVITYQDLKFTHTKSLVMTITISAMAFIGAYVFLWIRQCWRLSTKFMVMFTLGLYSILTAYFVITPYFTSKFGLRNEWEAWISIAYLGLIISTFFGVARVMMAELCPEGDENEWFSLFQLADKGSSWIGPFVTGAIQSITGEFRTGFWFPLALFVVGGALLLSVDMNKGKDEAIQYKADQQAKHRLLASIPPITITIARDSTSQA